MNAVEKKEKISKIEKLRKNLEKVVYNRISFQKQFKHMIQ